MITLFYSNIIALPNKMLVDKDLKSKTQDDLQMDQECYPETEVSIVSAVGGL